MEILTRQGNGRPAVINDGVENLHQPLDGSDITTTDRIARDAL